MDGCQWAFGLERINCLNKMIRSLKTPNPDLPTECVWCFAEGQNKDANEIQFHLVSILSLLKLNDFEQ